MTEDINKLHKEGQRLKLISDCFPDINDFRRILQEADIADEKRLSRLIELVKELVIK